MKRKLRSPLPASIILACISLCLCTACTERQTPDAANQSYDGQNTSPDNASPTASITFFASNGDLHAVTLPAMRSDETSDISVISNAQNTDSTQNAIVQNTARPLSVSFTFYTEERNTRKDNGIVFYTNRCIYPVVTIDGNKDAADKINADIQARVDSFHADNSLLELAEYDYDTFYDPEDSDSYFSAYTDEFIFTVTRADSNVISFLVTTQSYGGYVRGMDTYVGLNYDTQTGGLIAFADLSENTDAFRKDTLAFHQNLAAFNAYQSIMWQDATTDDLEEILYQDERWYLSTSGLVFFSNPYELGAFYAGKIEFTVPYTDLEKMGLKEKYYYEGAKTIRLQTEEAFLFDLNGDGQDEKIIFSIDKPGSYGSDLHFIINDTDYALEHKELSGQFSDNNYLSCWAKCFLYDMDAEDDTTEIAFQMNYSNWEENINMPYTFLYRYETTGALTYLGKTEGTVTNPTVVFSFGQ